jgi:hypothetical protein
MPATYEVISTTTLGSPQTSVSFSSFGGYTDLVLVIAGKSDGVNADWGLRFNSDTGSNYSRLYLYGSGSSALSGTNANTTYTQNMNFSNVDVEVNRVFIMNYANSTTFKTCLSRTDDAASLGTVAQVSTWRNTAAITTMSVVTAGASLLQTGTTLTLYGIKSA